MGRPEDALRSVEQAFPLLLSLHKQEPRQPTYRLFLRNAHFSRAETLGQLRRHHEAVADWDDVLRLETKPASAPFWRTRRADTLARAGQHRRAAAEADELGRAVSLRGARLYALACIHALNAASAGRDAALPLPVRDRLPERYAWQAVVLLQRAAEANYFRDPAVRAGLGSNDDLAALRGRDDYRAFIASLPPAKPKP
jgi:hypothetical protein